MIDPEKIAVAAILWALDNIDYGDIQVWMADHLSEEQKNALSDEVFELIDNVRFEFGGCNG